ncbi:PQQ-binding-like beta-propeller repeat protein [Desulfobacula phenolica]|uniref:WD40 repeat n=1 Tax=Desulfobacula phenolica TaxID=90732 RepID=A0A1H2K8C1_9BACT|nr:hypothetical protein [Desulfobacula phenolica]SDU64823.1 hypothetical protein SAMN04487931_1234 [Desulfobacula phenolica]
MNKISQELVPTGDFDCSLIDVNPMESNIFCASPRGIPTNFPITIIVDGSDISLLTIEKIRSVDGRETLEIPENKKTVILQSGLQAIELPLTEASSLSPGDYIIEIQMTEKDLFQRKTQKKINVSVSDYEIICFGIDFYIGESDRFVIATSPAAAQIYCKHNNKHLVTIGFPDIVMSACICNNNLFVLAQTGFLYIYSLQNFEMSTVRLSDQRQKTGFLFPGSGDNILCWKSEREEIHTFHYTFQNELTLISTEKSGKSNEEKEVVLKAGDLRLKFKAEVPYYIVEDSNGDQKKVEINGIVPSLVLIPSIANDQDKKFVWMQKGVYLNTYELDGEDSLKKVDSIEALHTQAMRFADDNLFLVSSAFLGFDKIDPFKSSPMIFWLSDKHEAIDTDILCSAVNIKDQLYAVGDNMGILNIWKPGKGFLQIQAHKASSCINFNRNEIYDSSFVSSLALTKDKRLISGGVDQVLKCHQICFDKKELTGYLLWEKDLDGGAQSILMTEDQMLVSTSNELMWMDPEDGEIIFKWSSSGAILDTIIPMEKGRFVLADWDGNIHIFANHTHERSSKICESSIFGLIKISEKNVFVINEAKELLLIDLGDEITVIGQCYYNLPWCDRNARDVCQNSDVPSIIVSEWVNNISSPAPVFSYPYKSFVLQDKKIYWSDFFKEISSLTPIVKEA